MKKSQEQFVAIAVLGVLLLAMGFSYVHYRTSTYVINNETFSLVGMLEYNDNGKKVYLPVFKRN